jgi:hypothetical protein
MKAIIRATKIGIGVARTNGIRAGVKTGRHFYYWAPRTRW